jgi:uncharacterized protein YacL
MLFLTAYSFFSSITSSIPINISIGIFGGLLFGLSLNGINYLLRSFELRSFNLIALGMLFGWLMGEAIFLIFNAAFDSKSIALDPQMVGIGKVLLFLTTCFLGVTMTLRASEELYVSIPFVKLKATTYKKKDIVLDASILLDPRMIDLASSGLLDHQLILARFIVKELSAQAEVLDEGVSAKARRCLEVIKKLEAIPFLDMRYTETDFPELKDSTSKLVRLARLLDCNIITADINRIQQSSIEGIRVINIHMLSNALKPITQSGEYIHIKVQRPGKEPRQGVGYMEDGTMVVVNGGAEYIGRTIKAQVLSVKHTSSGRMIFCNSCEEGGYPDDYSEYGNEPTALSSASAFFTL